MCRVFLIHYIFTHYHPDHVGGSIVFNDTELICSSRFDENYEWFSKKEDDDFKLEFPTKLIDNDEFILNGFNIKIFNGEGHSICGLIIVVNNEVVVVGDLMMESMEGQPCIPGICSDGSLISHIKSLEKIIDLKPRSMIMGHGRPIIEEGKILKEVNRRLYYLNRIKEGDSKITLNDCISGDINEWVLKEAHDSNVMLYQVER